MRLPLSGLFGKQRACSTTTSGRWRKSSIVITVTPGNANTRASTEDGPLTLQEESLDASHGLKVYVFSEDGTLDYSSATEPTGRLTLTGTGNGPYKSSEINVFSGEKLFFVFANDGSSGGMITAPGPTEIVGRFIDRELQVTFGNDGPDITGSTFLMGTLWPELIEAPAGGTADAPHTISLGIGRLASKVNLIDVELVKMTGSELKGNFSDPKYRLGTIPRKMFTVGHYEGNRLPVGTNGVLVKSAVHSALPWSTPADVNYLPPYYTNWLNKDDPFYTIENTTGRDEDGLQYFGNTTFIQLETIYTPADTEIFDPVTLTTGGTLINNTFWIAWIVDNPIAVNAFLAGKRIIVSSEPVPGNIHQDIDITAGFTKYENGKNYHKFPVFDPSESNAEMRNRVLRNHYYELRASGFFDLGSADVDVDPKEPIPSETSISIEVSVKPWNKVTGSTPVG